MLILAVLLQVSTTCQTNFGITTCQSQQAPRSVQPNIYPQTQIDSSAMANLGSAMRARKDRGRRKKVGKMIAAGDCNGAVNFALEKGELELAQYARATCVPQ